MKLSFLACVLTAAIGLHTVQAQDLSVVPVNRTITRNPVDGTLHLDEKAGVGLAWLNSTTFTNGSIEFDVRGKDVDQQSFVGIAFHGVNDAMYEAVYLRPFNFRSPDPVKRSYAVQYIALPDYDWPMLRSDMPGKFEQPIAAAPAPDSWVHVRVTVADTKVQVYINNAETPSLEVTSLAKQKGNRIGIWTGNGSGGDWKNVTVKENN